jgi:hypothetical protein
MLHVRWFPPVRTELWVLNFTYANCMDQTSARIFYAVTAAKNLLIFGANISNAFAEAPPPKQGFYIRPDKDFLDWWVKHKKRPPIPPGAVIPVLLAMQGHPESPWLWEKHADTILHKIGLRPSTHEPCLYSGLINCHQVLFLRQVENFAIACKDQSMANTLLDLLDNALTIPCKWMGLLDLYNGLDVTQTRDYVKLSCTTYVKRISEKHLSMWMKLFNVPSGRPTPLPGWESFMKTFLTATGDSNEKAQSNQSKSMGFLYCLGIGELIYALVTCRPDLSYAIVQCAQSSVCPSKIHYHVVKHILKYLYLTRHDGIYYW